MQFTRVVTPVDMEVWNASSNGNSFVISYESHSGPGFHGRTGFTASWRPIGQNKSAIRVSGSPFKGSSINNSVISFFDGMFSVLARSCSSNRREKGGGRDLRLPSRHQKL
jgi:hypothetical protein